VLTPSQPLPGGAGGCIELLRGHHLEEAVQDLVGFTRIWLVWWFHEHHHWRPQVLPPRGRVGRKGVLSTRSPHRPNPLGLTSVPLLAVQRNRLIIGSHDLLDGTPILDIKPYLPYADAFPDERTGWLEDVATPAAYRVENTTALHWLEPSLVERICTSLQSDPLPHRTRRITALGDDRYVLKFGSWRIFYRVVQDCVVIDRLASRHRLEDLGDDEESQLHRAFLER
jgi:tRNA-Thr(GGU) m(6)t(6)A37 methyltransferase TsaA